MVGSFNKGTIRTIDVGSYIKIVAQTKKYEFHPSKSSTNVTLNGLFAAESVQKRNSSNAYFADFDPSVESRERLSKAAKSADQLFAREVKAASLQKMRGIWFQKNHEVKQWLYNKADKRTFTVSLADVQEAEAKMAEYEFSCTLITISAVRKSQTEGEIPGGQRTKEGYFSRETVLSRVCTVYPLEQVEKLIEAGLFSRLLNTEVDVEVNREFQISTKKDGFGTTRYNVSPKSTIVRKDEAGEVLKEAPSDESILKKLCASSREVNQGMMPDSMTNNVDSLLATLMGAASAAAGT